MFFQLERIQYIRASKEPRKARVPEMPATSAASSPDFQRPIAINGTSFSGAAGFLGYVQGFVYKSGEQGLGYYRDEGSHGGRKNQRIAAKLRGLDMAFKNVSVSADAVGTARPSPIYERNKDQAAMHGQHVMSNQLEHNKNCSDSRRKPGTQGMDDQENSGADQGDMDMGDSSEAERRLLQDQPEDDDAQSDIDVEKHTGAYAVNFWYVMWISLGNCLKLGGWKCLCVPPSHVMFVVIRI